ncbi:MAG: ATP-binding cassette domain-containing protein [Anaerorhabdus sp.]|uniref:ATP-binding cassette domain-containing protein n=1 Tax=Anaerorhabdus sp. TaxID=1872524 RepID=UPI003A83C271
MKKIKIINLSKSFKGQDVISEFSAELEAGKIYGVSGRNGSGKTVLLKLLSGLLKATTGKIMIDDYQLGKDIEFPLSIGVIIDKPEFFDEYSGLKNLKILSEIKNVLSEQEVTEVMKYFGLFDLKKKVKKYSLGMKQRLGLAQAFMESPELLILDEFTNALDKEYTVFIHNEIRSYINDNRIIILTSHYEQDLYALCDEIYTIEDGNVKKYDN